MVVVIIEIEICLVMPVVWAFADPFMEKTIQVGGNVRKR